MTWRNIHDVDFGKMEPGDYWRALLVVSVGTALGLGLAFALILLAISQ